MFNGHLAVGERLTHAHRDATARLAIAKGVFDGVEFHDGWTREADRSLEAFVATHSIGVDFALQFSRNVFCARVPITDTALDEIIAFLNDKKTEYATGKADYTWDLLADNCVHTVRNALAAANTWAPIPAWEVKLRRLFNLAVPANEFVNLAVLGVEGPLDDYREVQGNGPSRDALHDLHWLPTRHGAVVKTLPVHEPNDVYYTDFRLFAVQSPLRMGTTAKLVRILSDAKSVELEANLRHFRDRYDAILAAHDYRRDPLASVRGTPYRRVGRLHLDYIAAQREEVDQMLRRLAEDDRLRAAPKGDTAPLGPVSLIDDGRS